VFDATSRKSWGEVANYSRDVDRFGTDDVPVVICAAQIDRLVPELGGEVAGNGDSNADDSDDEPVDWEDVREFLPTLNRRWAFCGVSALYGYQIEYLFALATALARLTDGKSDAQANGWSVPLNTEDDIEWIASLSSGKMVKSATKR
jgi:hypothetical protein